MTPAQVEAERRARGVTREQWRAAPPVPPTRGDCRGGVRPCPHLRCRHFIRIGGPETCSIDVAERGGASLDEVAELMGMAVSGLFDLETRALVSCAERDAERGGALRELHGP